MESWIHVCVYIYMHVYVCMYVCMYVCPYECMCTQGHMHIRKPYGVVVLLIRAFRSVFKVDWATVSVVVLKR